MKHDFFKLRFFTYFEKRISRAKTKLQDQGWWTETKIFSFSIVAKLIWEESMLIQREKLYLIGWRGKRLRSFICKRRIDLRIDLSASQKQGILTLVDKKSNDRTLLKNWRPVSLLNVDYKIAPKVLALSPSIINN